MSGDFLYVPNLEKWQHYKDRCPPWIKLHRDVLNDYKFSQLQDASKAHLLAIWLLASQLDNKIPFDARWISNRINATEEVDINRLINTGFLHIHDRDSEALASCKQGAVTETETETDSPPSSKLIVDTDTGEISDNPFGEV